MRVVCVFVCVCRAIGGEVSTDGDFLIFESNRYNRKGFLFKSFAMSAIVSTHHLQGLRCCRHVSDRRLVGGFGD